MHVANFIENTAPPPRTGQLSGLLDAGIIAAAAACIVVTVIPAGMFAHRAHELSTPAVFTATGDPDTAEAAAGPVGAPLLWRVQDGKATVWLFGSVPARHRDLTWMDSRLFQAFDGADAVWFETTGAMPAEGNIWGDRGASVLLNQRAGRLGKPVTAFGKTAAKIDEDVVLSGLWRSGDERGLLARLNTLGRLPSVPGVWPSRIEGALKEDKTTFVAVDAAQLLGPDGLVAQLRRDGHKVERFDP